MESMESTTVSLHLTLNSFESSKVSHASHPYISQTSRIRAYAYKYVTMELTGSHVWESCCIISSPWSTIKGEVHVQI